MLPRFYEDITLGDHTSKYENINAWEEVPDQVRSEIFNSGLGDKERLFIRKNIVIGFLDSKLYKINVMFFDDSFISRKLQLVEKHGKGKGWFKSTKWEDANTTLELYRRPKTNMVITDKELLRVRP